MRTLLCAVGLAVAGIACNETDNTDKCRAIGQTRESALQPDDRLYFEKHCQEYRMQARNEQLDRELEDLARTRGFANYDQMRTYKERESELEARITPRMSRKCYDGNVRLLTKKCLAEFEAIKKAILAEPQARR